MKTNTRLTLAALLTMIVCTLSQPILAQPLVTLAASHFDDTNSLGNTYILADGWLGTNNVNGVESRTFSLGGATSNSVGYISVSETAGDGSTMYFAAPAKFLGDMHAAYNGLLKLKLKQTATDNFSGHGDFVLLASSNLVLGFSLRGVPATTWTSFEVPLNEDVGWFNVTSNRFATRDDFAIVLKSLKRLWIRAEYSFNAFDRSDLDDVELLGQVSGPVQPSLAATTYAGITIVGAVGSVYRIEYRGAFDANNNWQKLTDVVLPISPYFFIDQSSPSASQRFYRAVLNP